MMTPARREVRRVFPSGDEIAKQRTKHAKGKQRTEILFTTKYNKTMKELIEILTNEDKSFDGLPKWVYIFALPAALVLACMIGGTLS
jgi:hypothetical protein